MGFSQWFLIPLLASGVAIASNPVVPIDGGIGNPNPKQIAEAPIDPPRSGSTPERLGEGGLQWPMGMVFEGEMVPGYGLYGLQNYGNSNPSYSNRDHSAIDINYATGGAATVNAPVYSIGDGVVTCATYANYPGDVVVVRHELSTGETLYSMYGHLTGSVSEGDSVTQGQVLGTVLPWPGDVGNTHLHFEVRDWATWTDGTCWGPGYASSGSSPDSEGWRDPVEAIFTHRPPYPGEGVVNPIDNLNVRGGPSVSYPLLGLIEINTPLDIGGVLPDDSGVPSWWYSVDGGYIAAFYHEGWASEIYVGEVPREEEESGGCDTTGSEGEHSPLWALMLMPLLVRLRRNHS